MKAAEERVPLMRNVALVFELNQGSCRKGGNIAEEIAISRACAL